ncbi:uncharacterized protein EI90DRAFT_3115173 [Cantharellus anzutake]|uniref:uncharacterized protein n=1 Tax=Cantharellus anzutake TaxID=1750568 RepID=UPI001903E07C|nr:uncharacterized protein EI90DRAFT_3115173 [Cantharellus anzutake]KAF8342592.1 hypothetical protein EI90DRAFT_3115173 [Cantharellus anzutake]
MDSDVLNVVVALVVIFGIFRWWSKPDAQTSNGATSSRTVSLGFRPHNVTPTMISTVQSAFPQEPRENIYYDLLRTGNVQVTCNKLLEKGFLPTPPPTFFTLYPQSTNVPVAPLRAQPEPPASATPSNLITRLGLDDRLSEPVGTLPKIDGKTTWLSTAEEREASLKERKAQMVLAARRRLLEKQKGAQAGEAAS